MEFLFGHYTYSKTPKESVYGKRDGTMSGLAITSRTTNNQFRQTKGWKTGVVLGVPMLARQDMFKPDQVTGLPG